MIKINYFLVKFRDMKLYKLVGYLLLAIHCFANTVMDGLGSACQ
jgi:hypothetical protein